MYIIHVLLGVQSTHSCVRWMCVPLGSWWWTSWPGHSWETNWQLSTLYCTCSLLCESHGPTTVHPTLPSCSLCLYLSSSHLHTHTCTHTCTHTFTHAHTHAHTFTHTYHTPMHAHTCTHTHTHTHSYGRTEVLALGKFTLNLTRCPPPQPTPLAHTLYSTLQQLLPKVHIYNGGEITYSSILTHTYITSHLPLVCDC